MNDQQKYCIRCGANMQIGQNFCTNCGAPQTLQVPQTPQPPQVQQMSQIPQMPQASQIPQALQTPTNTAQPKRNKNKGKLWFAICVPLVLLIIAVVAIAINLNIIGKDRTIMVYMIGSDLESQSAAASLDITEMKEANFDPQHTKLLIYTGGTKKWALDEVSPEENAIFEIADGSINKLQSYDKSLMTNPDNLTNFINYSYENYPADYYDLILWDHGGGPIFGYGIDENSLSGTPMKMTSLADALSKTSLITSGKKFDFIGFDACLMGSMEVAKALSNYSNYMIASEEVEPGDGWNYDFLDNLSKDSKIQTSEELAKSIIDQYISSYDDYWYDVDLSMSLIDLKELDPLIDSVDSLFSTVKDEITSQTFSQYSRTMTRDKVYGYSGRDSESYDLVDLMDLCQSLENTHSDEVDKIEESLNRAVKYSRSNIDNTNGLSVYFLNYNKQAAEEMLSKYKEVAFSEKYYDFLTKYKNFVTGDRRVTRKVYSDLPKDRDASNAIEIELSDELKDNYQSGEIIIFRKLGDNKFMPVYRSSEVELDGNKLRATSYNLQFVVEVTDANGEVGYGWSMMAEKERTVDYADYVSFGILAYNDDSYLGFSTKNYEMHIRVQSGDNEGQIRDIRVDPDEETGLASKMSFDPNKIKFIDLFTGTYKLYNDSGELDYNMESHEMLYGTEANIEKGDTYKVKLVGLDFDFGDIYDGEFKNTKDYYAEFIVHDTQGDSHQLNLVHIEQ